MTSITGAADGSMDPMAPDSRLRPRIRGRSDPFYSRRQTSGVTSAFGS